MAVIRAQFSYCEWPHVYVAQKQFQCYGVTSHEELVLVIMVVVVVDGLVGSNAGGHDNASVAMLFLADQLAAAAAPEARWSSFAFMFSMDRGHELTNVGPGDLNGCRSKQRPTGPTRGV